MTDEVAHISDTAFWVAAYRALESERPDALFRDPLAKLLVDARGFELARKVPYPEQAYLTIIMRTLIIDGFISTALEEGGNHVLNLGAGLDTRPYRLNLPPTLRWTEVDHPNIVGLKNSRLAKQPARCRLERIALDLKDRDARRRLFSSIGAESRKVFILAEGLVYYLDNEEVARLCEDLASVPSFRYWALGYLSREGLQRFREKRHTKQLKSVPLLFDPPNWREFFESRGWKLRDLRYMVVESERRGRPYPYPWPLNLLRRVLQKARDDFARSEGYGLLERATA